MVRQLVGLGRLGRAGWGGSVGCYMRHRVYISDLGSCRPTPVTVESCGTMHRGQRQLFLLPLLAICLGVYTRGWGPGEARSRGPRP